MDTSDDKDMLMRKLVIYEFWVILYLTLSWRRPLSYRNQTIDLLHKSMDWFRYDNGHRHERVNVWVIVCLLSMSEKIRRNDTLFWNSKAKHLIEKIIAEIEVWVKHQCRNDRWWRDMWSPQFLFDLWKKNFRMSREEFIELCEQLRPFITPNALSLTYRALPVEKRWR